MQPYSLIKFSCIIILKCEILHNFQILQSQIGYFPFCCKVGSHITGFDLNSSVNAQESELCQQRVSHGIAKPLLTGKLFQCGKHYPGITVEQTGSQTICRYLFFKSWLQFSVASSSVCSLSPLETICHLFFHFCISPSELEHFQPVDCTFLNTVLKTESYCNCNVHIVVRKSKVQLCYKVVQEWMINIYFIVLFEALSRCLVQSYLMTKVGLFSSFPASPASFSIKVFIKVFRILSYFLSSRKYDFHRTVHDQKPPSEVHDTERELFV